jgi:hypothetical protein
MSAQIKPICFVSYSTREPQVQVLIDCLRIVLSEHLDVRLTPSALESGASQRDQIISLIDQCTLAVVVLDGLRPNVVFELGAIHAKGRPFILFKESDALVDILGLFAGPIPAELKINPLPVNLDTQLSNIKDVNYAKWNRYEILETVKTVWSEYSKKQRENGALIEIPEPKLCQ